MNQKINQCFYCLNEFLTAHELNIHLSKCVPYIVCGTGAQYIPEPKFIIERY